MECERSQRYRHAKLDMRNCRVIVGVSLLLALAAPAAAAESPPSAATTSAAGLPQGVQNVIDHRDLPLDTLSLYVFDLESGTIRLSLNADVPRNPASVMKLLTTLVALDTLGPAYRWRTEAWTLGEFDGDVLDGDLLLKGYGDPFLVTERVWQMLRGMRRQGLRDISGDLLIDDSYFSIDGYDPAAFDRQPLRAYNVAPNALMMNFKVVRWLFEPDRDRGAVQIRMDPELNNLKLTNRLSVRNGSCRGYQRGIAIIPNDSYDEFTFSGEFPSGCSVYSMTRAALDHNEFVYGLFRSMWREVGGEFDGGWRNVAHEPAEDAEPFFVFESWPLADVISRVNKYSNNVMTRQLLFTLGAERYGPPGTEEKGRRAVADWLEERGFRFPELVLENGAGRSREARITARHMGELLAAAWASPWMPEFAASMAISGMDGTYGRRRGASIAGRARLKTGSLDHVSTLAGYLQAGDGVRYAVVVLHNAGEVHRGPGDELQDALLEWLNQFSLSHEAP